MTVRIALAPLLGERIGGRSAVEAEGRTVAEVLGALTRAHPELSGLLWKGEAAPNPYLVIFLNDRNIADLQGLATPVADGDELVVVSALEGGWLNFRR